MWQWILNSLNNAAKHLKCNRSMKDDLVSEVTLKLCEKQELAKRIYENKEVGLLYQMLRFELYETNSKGFDNKMAFSRYLRIVEVCTKYKIDPIPDNAYKIAAILDDATNFPISGVYNLLKQGQAQEYHYMDDSEADGKARK